MAEVRFLLLLSVLLLCGDACSAFSLGTKPPLQLKTRSVNLGAYGIRNAGDTASLRERAPISTWANRLPLRSAASSRSLRASTLDSSESAVRSAHPIPALAKLARMPSIVKRLAALSLGIWLVTACSAPVFAKSAVAVAQPTGFARFLHFILHLDKELVQIIAKYGKATYAILFGIVFCETGLVVTPFLPGDSLLFACGALCAIGSLKLSLTLAIFLTAAVLGDAVNYAIGHAIGPKAFELDTWFLKKKNLRKTELLYDKHGAKAIVLARFIPIVRTFAPFLAGVGSMSYGTFGFYNVLGAVIWTLSFTGAGYFFGNLPSVKDNFAHVIAGIVIVSVLPVIYEIYKENKEGGGKPAE